MHAVWNRIERDHAEARAAARNADHATLARPSRADRLTALLTDINTPQPSAAEQNADKFDRMRDATLARRQEPSGAEKAADAISHVAAIRRDASARADQGPPRAADRAAREEPEKERPTTHDFVPPNVRKAAPTIAGPGGSGRPSSSYSSGPVPRVRPTLTTERPEPPRVTETKTHRQEIRAGQPGTATMSDRLARLLSEGPLSKDHAEQAARTVERSRDGRGGREDGFSR